MFGLADLPVVGPILFHQSALVYASWALVVLIAFYLGARAPGLNVRAVGESAGRGRRDGDQRHALPLRARARRRRARRDRRRLLQPLRSRPGWTDGDSLVGGAGWIAIALVIFSFWRPELCLVGAYLFGGLSGGLPSALQAHPYGGSRRSFSRRSS